MQKVVVIILLVPFIAGCAALSKRKLPEAVDKEKNRVSNEEIRELNLTNNDFNVIKAEIKIINNDEKEKLIGNIKYESGGKYLISIRNKTGMRAQGYILLRIQLW